MKNQINFRWVVCLARIITLILIGMLCISLSGMAQPQSFNFQAVLRNSEGHLLADQNIGIQASILQGSPSGPAVYCETHSIFTNSAGVIDIKIGNGTVVSGIFHDIEWESDDFFIQIELDETGGTNYQLMGVSKLLSVPYALHTRKANEMVLPFYQQTSTINSAFTIINDADGIAIEGQNSNHETIGYLGTPNHGVFGQHPNGYYGHIGSSTSALYGAYTGPVGSGTYGLIADPGVGVSGFNAEEGTSGSLATYSYGVRGNHSNGNFGYLGSNNYGVYGEHEFGNYGYLGSLSYGVYGNSVSGHAGYFQGDAFVSGNMGVGVESPAEKLEVDGYIKTSMGYKFPDGSLQTSAGQLNLPFTDTANAPETAVFEIVGNSCQAAVRGKISFEGTFGELGASHFDAPDPFGVYGQTESGYGVMGRYTSNGRFGYLGGSQYAVYGQDGDGIHRGHMGSNTAAVRGDYYHLGYGYNIYGILGNGAFGVYGNNPEGPGTSGYIASYNIAVAGINGDYVSGYLGDTQHNTMGYGVYGTHDIGNSGYLGGWFHGVYGQSVTGNIGYLAGFDNAVYGSSTSGFAAYFEGKGYFSNNLGIGTDTPAKPLHLVSEYDQPLLIESTDQYSGIELKDPTTTVTPKLMADGDHIYFQTDGTTRMKILSNGYVGINTSDPQATLHINDLMMLEPRTAAPASPQEGMIYYDETTHKLRVYNGTGWHDCF